MSQTDRLQLYAAMDRRTSETHEKTRPCEDRVELYEFESGCV